MTTLYQKLVNREEKISLIGLGYVGMPIAVTFAISGCPFMMRATWRAPRIVSTAPVCAPMAPVCAVKDAARPDSSACATKAASSAAFSRMAAGLRARRSCPKSQRNLQRSMHTGHSSHR